MLFATPINILYFFLFIKIGKSKLIILIIIIIIIQIKLKIIINNINYKNEVTWTPTIDFGDQHTAIILHSYITFLY